MKKKSLVDKIIDALVERDKKIKHLKRYIDNINRDTHKLATRIGEELSNTNHKLAVLEEENNLLLNKVAFMEERLDRLQGLGAE